MGWNKREIDKFELDIKSKTPEQLAVIHEEIWPPRNEDDFIKAGRLLVEVESRGLTEEQVMTLQK
jgi:hypothetical protein